MPHVIEIQLIGYISRAASLLALDRARDIVESSSIDTMVWDLTRHTGNDPGNLAHAVRWMRSHGNTIKTSLVISSNPVVAGFVRVSRVLLPGRAQTVYAHREDALAELASLAYKRRRPAA